MIVGALPFEDENLKGLYKKIGEGRFTFPDHVSPLARDLIQSMLQVNTLHRATMNHIRMHPWVNEGIGVIPESYVPLRPAHVPNPRDDLIRLLPEYGYNLSGDALRSTVIVQPDSPVFAGYCMLEEKEQREMMSCQQPISSGSAAIRIQPQPSRYVYGSPGKQQMASSLKEYRPIVPVIEPGWSEFEVQAPRYSVNLDTSAGHFSSVPTTPIKQPIARVHNQTPSSLGIQHPSVSGTPGAGGHSNIMAQAAATVVNKFRRLKDIKLGFGSESPRGSRRGSTQNNNVMHL
jgi:serine/threonine protein kinase